MFWINQYFSFKLYFCNFLCCKIIIIKNFVIFLNVIFKGFFFSKKVILPCKYLKHQTIYLKQKKKISGLSSILVQQRKRFYYHQIKFQIQLFLFVNHISICFSSFTYLKLVWWAKCYQICRCMTYIVNNEPKYYLTKRDIFKVIWFTIFLFPWKLYL